jgi:nucleoside-diphosphate-sugar epimerase
VLVAAAGLIEAGARLLGRTPPISRHTMMFISRHAVYPNEHAREVLGWEPQVDLDEGMRRTEAWLRAEGALP